MTEKLKNEIIKDFEDRVNNKINTLYDIFYIQPYRSSNPNKYGAIFNGNQIALCESLRELEQVINTIIFFLEGGITKE
jgi:hypothetical protein